MGFKFITVQSIFTKCINIRLTLIIFFSILACFTHKNSLFDLILSLGLVIFFTQFLLLLGVVGFYCMSIQEFYVN